MADFRLRGPAIRLAVAGTLATTGLGVQAIVPIRTTGPVLFCSDLISGPATGNSDTSLGQTANEHGAIVTIFGKGFGASQGSSTLTCCGRPAARIYYWGPVTPQSLPHARLDNQWQQMDMIEFQVDGLASAGPGTIQITVNGEASNLLPFTVVAGRIRFARIDGSDTSPADGTWQAPYRTIKRLKDVLNQPGDIGYIGDGVNQTSGDGASGYFLNVQATGTQSQPIALCAYPGASVQIGSLTASGNVDRVIIHHPFQSSYNDVPKYRTISKIGIFGGDTAYYGREGHRLVACKISTPLGGGKTGALYWVGSFLKALACEFTDCGANTADNFYHTIYSSGKRQDGGPWPDEVDREIAWCYAHNNKADTFVQVFNFPEVLGIEDGAHLKEHRVHDNVIMDQSADGIKFGAFCKGENWAWNNLFVRCSQRAINLRDSGQTVYIYNNTMVNCGHSANGGSSGLIEFAASGGTYFIVNNIWSQTNGEPYVSENSIARALDPTRYHHNLFHGMGAPPSYLATDSLNVDPLFASPSIDDYRLQDASPARDFGVEV